MRNVNEEIISEIDIVCEKIHDYDIEEISLNVLGFF